MRRRRDGDGEIAARRQRCGQRWRREIELQVFHVEVTRAQKRRWLAQMFGRVVDGAWQCIVERRWPFKPRLVPEATRVHDRRGHEQEEG